MDSAREVPREALEGGFVFRTLEAVQPAEAENVYR
jgi:hypothetical protein